MNIRRVAVVLIVVISLIFSAGCELVPGVQETETANGSLPEPTASDVIPINPEWAAPSADGLSEALPSIADVVARVKPSVVAITTEVVNVGLFNQPYTQEGGGSGWIVSADGIIVTNNHVVENAESISVTLDDGRVMPVDISTVATDPQTDLAVLKIDAENLVAATVGNSDALRVGDWVIAIGNALGQGIRATQGIVSQTDVEIGEEVGQPLKLVETDAAINPGNSGGPLVNMAGEVVGITSIKLVDVSIEGVGYAIGMTEALPIIQDLINTGYVVRPWLGVGTQTVTSTLVFWYRLPVEEGVLITNVAQGSPADIAGLREGDVVVSFRGFDVTTAYGMVRQIHAAEVGDTVKIVYWRDNARHTAEAVLVRSPAPED